MPAYVRLLEAVEQAARCFANARDGRESGAAMEALYAALEALDRWRAVHPTSHL